MSSGSGFPTTRPYFYWQQFKKHFKTSVVINIRVYLSHVRQTISETLFCTKYCNVLHKEFWTLKYHKFLS